MWASIESVPSALNRVRLAAHPHSALENDGGDVNVSRLAD